MSQSSLITPMIVLITGHFSNSAKFHGHVKILWQRANSMSRNSHSKFHSPWKTVGPSNDMLWLLLMR